MTSAETRAPALAFVILVLLDTATATAGSHTWDVNELFSNADGTIQFIELWEANGTPNETGVPGKTVSSNSNSFVIPGAPLAPPTSNRFFLIATEAFAALPGAPTPDALIPAGSVPFFATTGDTVSYQPWDSLTFGAGVLPTDGIDSLNRDLSTGPNSPTNYAGTTGSVNATPPAPTPALPALGLVPLGGLLLLVGSVLASRSRSTRAR